MKKCPFCDGPAVSGHHIVPLALGGTDEPRNKIWLCKTCHDAHEGKEITPDMIRLERIRNLGKNAVGQEEYHWAVSSEGMLFMGIHLLGQKTELLGQPVFFPYRAQVSFLPPPEIETPTVNLTRKRKRGRPPIVLSPDVILGQGSLRQKASQLKVSPMTVQRRIKEIIQAKPAFAETLRAGRGFYPPKRFSCKGG